MKTIEEYQDDNKKKSEISFYAFFGIDDKGNTTNRAFYDLEEARQEAEFWLKDIEKKDITRFSFQ